MQPLLNDFNKRLNLCQEFFNVGLKNVIDIIIFKHIMKYKGGMIMLKYYKLFDLLNRRGMKKMDLLQAGISAPIISKLAKGETVKTDMIDKICNFLECQPGDIMEHIIEEKILHAKDEEIHIIKQNVITGKEEKKAVKTKVQGRSKKGELIEELSALETNEE